MQMTLLCGYGAPQNLITWKEYNNAGSVAASCYGPSGTVVAIDQESSGLKLWRDGKWETHYAPDIIGPMLQPTGVAVTDDGTIYISDTGNDRILEVSNSGKWKRISYGTGTGAGYFNKPRGITIDNNGIIYVADYKNNRIQYYNGSWHTISGTLSGPLDVAIDRNDNLLVADFNNDRIAVYNILKSTWSEYKSMDYLRRPTGVACTSNGTVLVSSIINSSVTSRSKNGSWGMLLSSSKVSSPCALSVDAYDNIYVSDISKKSVLRSKCANTKLEFIKINDDSIHPNSTMAYTVDAEMDSVDITAYPDSPYSKITGNGNIQLAPGENIVTLTVLPESGAPIDYTINITRQVEVDMSLSSLKVDGEDVQGFDASRSDYSMLVPFNKDKIVVDAVPISTMTQVQGSGEVPLSEGQNIVNIKVVAQDGSSHDYTLNITRENIELPSPTNVVNENLSPEDAAAIDELSQPVPDNRVNNTGITVTIIIVSLMLMAMIGGIISLLIKRYNNG